MVVGRALQADSFGPARALSGSAFRHDRRLGVGPCLRFAASAHPRRDLLSSLRFLRPGQHGLVPAIQPGLFPGPSRRRLLAAESLLGLPVLATTGGGETGSSQPERSSLSFESADALQ